MSQTTTDRAIVRLPLSVWISVAGSLLLAGSSLGVTYYQVGDVRERLAEVERQKSADRELLVRIDERTAEMREQLKRLTK